MSEVALAVEYPETPWDLSIDTGEICIATRLESWLHYLQSFWSNAHSESLKGRLVDILSKEHNAILLEKVGAIANRNGKSWFHGIEGKNPEELLYAKDGIQTFPGQIIPVIEGGRYRNFPGENLWNQFWETQRLMFVGNNDPVTHLDDLEGAYRVVPEVIPRNDSMEPRITWIGHASLLIQVAGFNILTDPSFEFVFPCFKRHVPPGIDRQGLPFIDLILNSHNHGDHANKLETFAPFNPLIFSGAKTEGWLKNLGFERVVANDWWQTTMITRGDQSIKVTAVPAQHGSQLSLMDANTMLWCGYVLEVGDKVLYFAGDTAMGAKMVDKDGDEQSLFEQLHDRFPHIDVAFLPIAPEGEPLVHIDHEEAVHAFKTLGAKEVIPIHWGAYRTGSEAIEEPIEAFLAFAEEQGISEQVRMLKVGETCILEPAVEAAII